MLTIPSDSGRRLRVPGYLTLAMMTLIQIVEVCMRAWPLRIHSPAWRLGVIASAANSIGAPLLAFFLMLAIAVFAGDRIVAYVIAALSALFALMCFLAMGVYSLDALQMRSQVQGSLSHQFDLTSVWLVFRLALSLLIFSVLSISAFRTAKGIRAQTGRMPAGKGSTLVVGVPRPGAISPAMSGAAVPGPASSASRGVSGPESP